MTQKRQRILDLSEPVVMGILNVTPDSFTDGGDFLDPSDAAARAESMVREGARIIDVGGESTRPWSEPVTPAAQLQRILPVIEALAGKLDVTISVDTQNPEVMREAVAAGAGMINDVNALRTPGALETAAEAAVPVCLMHMQGEPRNMQDNPHYEDVVQEVVGFLQERARAAERAGMAREHIVIDPGFGFGKTVTHNLELLSGLRQLSDLGYPLMVGMSRKSMLRDLLRVPPRERIFGGLAGAVLAVERGARMIRTHDVRATVEALKVSAAAREKSGAGLGAICPGVKS